MELKVFWTAFAEKELFQIYDYYKDRASKRVAKKLASGIWDASHKLQKHPEIGQIEDLLISRKQEFRYLVYKNYKLIYWINNNKHRIEIMDVFDVRQNPKKIKRSL